MSTVRIQFDVPSSKIEELEKLMDEVNISTRKELFNNALTFFEWAVKERKKNRIIASVDEHVNKYQEVIMPVLSNISASEKDEEVSEELALSELVDASASPDDATATVPILGIPPVSTTG